MFLYETIDTIKLHGGEKYKDLPPYIPQSLNPSFELRPYQKNAFCNFITYFETPSLKQNPTQTLFHMATGSGKTIIMAGLMLYLYKQGYRNFLFFVNLDNIVQKTKENFLNTKSAKYLFAKEINISGQTIPINEVTNFQYSNTNAINICFTTIQGLHSAMWGVRENGMSDDDFCQNKTVFISDEAHHINADTKKGGKIVIDENTRSWEYTVSRIFNMNNQNILLEFTATCNLANQYIRTLYKNKIIFDYPLRKFREEKYSKEIKTLRTDVSIMDRALFAIIVSQYRLKLFQQNRLSIKPVVLFKAAKIDESKQFMSDFIQTVQSLTSNEVIRLKNLTDTSIIKTAFAFFVQNNIPYELIAQELKEEFSVDHCISVNDESEAEKTQIIVNSLEEKNNPYRAVFEVKKLDEGWDVLNLFDIVRLYETRQSGGKAMSQTTINEAQLIGRGARYCPFVLTEEQNKYQRKYDDDITNPLRVCEELYYHCQNDSRYIAELTQALIETGIIAQNAVQYELSLKEEFQSNELYKTGLVFMNKKVVKSRKSIVGLPESLIREYTVFCKTGTSAEDTILTDLVSTEETANEQNYTKRITIKEIAEINYNIVHKALRQYPAYMFNTLKSRFPNLDSTRQFITDTNYLANITILLISKEKDPAISVLYDACKFVFGKIADLIITLQEAYAGTKEFKPEYVHKVFKTKTVNYTDPHDGGIGISQNDATVPKEYKIDLSKEDWFVFSDNYGTSEEKAFVAYFKTFVDQLKVKYQDVFLIRNERQLALYTFTDGERFEPDYVLFLRKKKTDGYEQLQIFIEPKGNHLLLQDAYKEKFLLQLKTESVPTLVYTSNNKYNIYGFHFYNKENRHTEFEQDIKGLL